MLAQLGGLVTNRLERWPDSYTEDEPTLGQDVERGCLFGEQHRLSQPEDDDGCNQSYPLGTGSDKSQRLQCLVEVPIIARAIGILHSRGDSETVEYEVVADRHCIKLELFGGLCDTKDRVS
jgi:hypothetical protein